jgi:hypothetical protein
MIHTDAMGSRTLFEVLTLGRPDRRLNVEYQAPNVGKVALPKIGNPFQRAFQFCVREARTGVPKMRWPNPKNSTSPNLEKFN